MHRWFERKIPESADADVDQPERWVIEANVAAALCAITAIADVAAFEFAEKVIAFGEVHILPFPQRERAYRRGGDRGTRRTVGDGLLSLRKLPALFRRARERVHVVEMGEREADERRGVPRKIQEQRNQRSSLLHKM